MALTKQQILDAFDQWGTDKGFRHHYETMYHNMFGDYEPTTLMEIGVSRGKSLAAWKQLFPSTALTGVEKFLDVEALVDPLDGVELINAASGDPTFVENLADRKFDVIIDDGDHRVDYQWKTFQLLKGHFTKYYVIEDIDGIDHVETLKRRLNSRGFGELVVYSSALKGTTMRRGGVQVPVDFYSILIKR